MTSIAGVSLRLILTFLTVAKRYVVHTMACFVMINHGDANDDKDINEGDWRRMSEDDEQDDNGYCTTSDDE